MREFFRWLGLDRAVFFTAAGRVWNIGAGFITMAIVGTRMSKEMQGYHYTFSSVMALQTFLELGFGQSLLQHASNEFPKLSFGPGASLLGDPAARARICAFGKLALRWYATAALLLMIGVGTGGHFFLAAKGSTGVAWTGPWWAFCAVAAPGLCLLPLWFLLEGCNQVAAVNRVRLLGSIAGNLASWSVILGGAALYACCAYAAGSLLVGATALFWKWGGFVRDISGAAAMPVRRWLAEVWPYQWRVAVSWICGYFTTSIITPLMFSLHGPTVAGQMGMTWQAVSGVSALAMAWTQTKAAPYGMWISTARFDELDRAFSFATRRAVGIAAGGSMLLVALVAVLKSSLPLGERFLSLHAVAFFCAAITLQQITASMAVYLRAFRREPYMPISILAAVLTTAGVALLGWLWAGFGAALACLAVSGGIILPLAARIFRRLRLDFRREMSG